MPSKTRKFLSPTLAAALGMLLSAGCQHNQWHAINKKISPADKQFETTEDPPITAATHFAAAQLAESRGDNKEAIEQYWAVVKMEPKNRDALFQLGTLYTRIQQFPDAIAAWTRYIDATGGDATGYSNLGFCHELAGHRGAAEEAYIKGIAKDAKNVPCRVNYGLMLARDNRIPEAEIQLQAVLSPAEVHYNLASVYELLGRKDQARAEYRRALTLDPGLTDAEARLSALQ
jgi:tetratricopeptide (TPR) repeat protein